MKAPAKSSKLKTSARKRTSALAQDIGLVVVSSLLSAATGFAAARDLRGAMIGATGGAALPLAYRAVLTQDPTRRIGYGATSLMLVGISFYLSWTRGALVTTHQLATQFEEQPQTLQLSTQPNAAPTAGLGTAGTGCFGTSMHGG